MIRGAIFDLDGTLLDSMPLWEHAGEQYLLSRGATPEPDLREALRALSLRQAADHLRARYALPEGPEEIMRQIEEMLATAYRERLALKPGARALLSQLAGAGVRMCVATATERPLAEAALARNGVLNFFSFLITCTEMGSGKDQPFLFRQALARLGTLKAETWVFEDALHAIETAKADGFPVAAVYDPAEAGHFAQIARLADRFLDNLSEWGQPS